MANSTFGPLNSLDEFSFIGGNSYTLEFVVYESDEVTPLDLGGATVKWVLSYYGQPDYAVINNIGTITDVNKFEIELSSSDTKLLYGKFIQQPVITSFLGSEYRPAQGIITIVSAIPIV